MIVKESGVVKCYQKQIMLLLKEKEKLWKGEKFSLKTEKTLFYWFFFNYSVCWFKRPVHSYDNND